MFNFLWQECKSLHGEYVGRACGHEHPYVPDVLFWSVILFFSTVTLSATLKQFKTSRYFPTKVFRLQFSWLKCQPTWSMLWSHTCFRTKERATVIIKGASKRFLCDWAARLGAGGGGSNEKGFCDIGAGSASSLQAYLLTSNPRNKLPLSLLSLLELKSAHCITDCHFLAQWRVGTIPAWQTLHRSHCYIL